MLPQVRPPLRHADRGAHQAAPSTRAASPRRIATIQPEDPLAFRRLQALRRSPARGAEAGGRARRVPRGAWRRIGGRPVSIGFFVFEFMGGSMGSVVGEKITRLFERALAERRAGDHLHRLGRRAHAGGHPVADADGEDVARRWRGLREAGVPYISVLLHPTTGGVAASFAMLGDVISPSPRRSSASPGRA